MSESPILGRSLTEAGESVEDISASEVDREVLIKLSLLLSR